MNIKKYIFVIILLALSFFSIRALTNPGFFPIHDDEQVGRLFELHNSLSAGHIPPRLSQNLGFGYDYPFFNFYPPLVYYVSEVFNVLGFGYIASIKLMIALGFILSGLFMYLFAKEIVGRYGALVAAVLYLYAPYHSIDVYVRGALPEFFSFVFIPAIFWAYLKLKEKGTIGFILTAALFNAALVLTHNLVALMAAPFIALFIIYLAWEVKNKKKFLVDVLISGVLAILLASYFFIPAFLENKYTMVNLLTQQLASYPLHFVSIRQFFNSAWGYGGSILGPMDGFSLEIGKVHLIALGLSLLVFLKARKKDVLFFLLLIMFAASVFLQTYYSKPIWDAIQALSFIQFPWRFMLFSVFFISLIAGYIFKYIENDSVKKFLSFGIILVAIAFYFPLFKPSEYLLDVKDEDYTAEQVIRWKTSAMAFEYVPKGIGTKISPLGTTIVDIEESEIAKSPYEVLEGDVVVKTLEDKPHIKRFEVISLNPARLRLNTFSFPGWKVFLNNKEISYNDDNKLKLITLDLPKGSFQVRAEFRDTSVRKVANLLTVLGIAGVIILLPFYKKRLKYEKT